MILRIIRIIFDWSEVWALLIPLIIFIIRKPTYNWVTPVKWYLLTALLLNISIDFVWYVNMYDLWGSVKGDRWNNNIFYNLHSIARLIFFSWFFILLRQRFMHRIKAIIPFGFLLFVLINFIFYENFFPQGSKEGFSSRLLATEAALLLFYCLQYFIFLMMDDKTISLSRQPGFWIVTGLSIYVSVNFFIFLFYSYLFSVEIFAAHIWDVHNIVFILLCLFITKQFYQKNE
jgi:hypothetical protein